MGKLLVRVCPKLGGRVWAEDPPGRKSRPVVADEGPALLLQVWTGVHISCHPERRIPAVFAEPGRFRRALSAQAGGNAGRATGDPSRMKWIEGGSHVVFNVNVIHSDI